VSHRTEHAARVSRGALTKLTPEFRTARARKAAAASHGAAGAISRFLRALPELSPEQIDVIRRALPPAPDGGASDAT
jgi:hypothetical protein